MVEVEFGFKNLFNIIEKLLSNLKFYIITKRIFDVFVSFFGIILFSPLMIFIAFCVFLTSPGPIIYFGERVGTRGKKFNIYKFRTMVLDAEKGSATTSANDIRITKFGWHLRKYKLDELPQLFNVLFGSMSIVGPRPEIPRFVELYDKEHRKILEATPGITDLASLYFKDMNTIIDDNKPEISYKNLVWTKKNELRLKYVRERTFFGDIVIILKTIFIILKVK